MVEPSVPCLHQGKDLYAIENDVFWLCQVCGNLNLENREQCNMNVCSAPRGFPGTYNCPPDGVRIPDPHHILRGEWNCNQCQSHNKKRQSILCAKSGCLAHRPGALILQTPLKAGATSDPYLLEKPDSNNNHEALNVVSHGIPGFLAPSHSTPFTTTTGMDTGLSPIGHASSHPPAQLAADPHVKPTLQYFPQQGGTSTVAAAAGQIPSTANPNASGGHGGRIQGMQRFATMHQQSSIQQQQQQQQQMWFDSNAPQAFHVATQPPQQTQMFIVPQDARITFPQQQHQFQYPQAQQHQHMPVQQAQQQQFVMVQVQSQPT